LKCFYQIKPKVQSYGKLSTDKEFLLPPHFIRFFFSRSGFSFFLLDIIDEDPANVFPPQSLGARSLTVSPTGSVASQVAIRDKIIA